MKQIRRSHPAGLPDGAAVVCGNSMQHKGFRPV
jgi:hypothetical protein